MAGQTAGRTDGRREGGTDGQTDGGLITQYKELACFARSQIIRPKPPHVFVTSLDHFEVLRTSHF